MDLFYDGAGSNRAAVGGITILAWFHNEELIARIKQTSDVLSGSTRTTMVTTAQQIHEAVDSWLSEIEHQGLGNP